jgi:hypothetical protein
MVERSIRLAFLALTNEDSPRFFYLEWENFPTMVSGKVQQYVVAFSLDCDYIARVGPAY